MKNFYTIILVIYAFIFQSLAQEAIDLSELKPPSSPAFTILGLQPTEIARPKTFEALEASLLNSFFQENNFRLSNNLAIEFSPYWLASHPDLTFERYINPTIGDNILFNSSLSIGTVKYNSAVDTNIVSTDIGFGYRTMIFTGQPLQENEELIKSVKIISLNQSLILDSYNMVVTYMNSCSNVSELIDSINYNMETYWGNSANETQDRIKIINTIVIPYLSVLVETNYQDAEDKILHELLNRLTGLAHYKAITEAASKLENANKDNVGFLLEFAAAFVLDFPTSTFQYTKIPKWGIWLTPTYRLENQTFEFLGLLRFIKNEIPSQPSDNFDFGVKVNYQLDRFSVSAECIGRYQTATIFEETINDTTTTSKVSSSDFRAVVNLDYRITDNLILSYSFGENFNLNTELANDLISVFSLNFGIGGPTTNSFNLE